MASASGHGPDERVLVARLELVRVIGGERHQIGDPEVGRARGEHIGERQGAHRRVPAGAATTDEEAFAVGVATLDQELGGVQAIVQVHDAPVAVQPLAVGPAVARGTAVVHIDHAEPAGGEELQTEIERGGGRARRAAMADHDQRRAISLGSGRILIGRWVEERVRAQAAVGRETRSPPGPTGSPARPERASSPAAPRSSARRSPARSPDPVRLPTRP